MTIKQISRLSGYSTSTVSKALNNGRDISVDTKRLIKEIAVKYNYKPNRNAVALRKSKTHIIAVIVPQINHKVYSELLYNIYKTAYSSGYRIMLYQTQEKKSKEERIFEEISDGSIDAAIVISNNGELYIESPIPIEHFQICGEHSEANPLDMYDSNFKNLFERIK